MKTNSDYQVAATLSVQDEKTDTIRKALQMISDWNPSWKPQCFMTDNCAEEISAIEHVFQGHLKTN